MKRLLLLSLLVALAAVLWWRSSDRAPQAKEDGQRSIEFLPALPPVDDRPSARASEAPVIEHGQARITGRCVDASGAPLADVEITSSYPPAAARTNWEGRFELTLSAATEERSLVQLRARGVGLGVGWMRVALEQRTEGSAGDWVLHPAVTLRGWVRDSEGAPLAGVEVRCTAAEFACEQGCFTPRGATLCSGVTDAAGVFELVDAPAGAVCVWAGEDGRTLWVSTPPLEARPGTTIEGLELVAPRVARENLLGVRVLLPSGEPLAGARIDYRFHDRTGGGAGRGEANAAGHWVLEVATRSPHQVVASDPLGRFQPTMLRNLAPGVLDAPLVLGPSRPCELIVSGSDGAPLERFAWRLVEATDDSVAPGVPVDPIVLLDEPEQARRAGRASLPTPNFPFWVEVSATGAFGLRAGPFDPAKVGAELALSIAAPPGVRGAITLEGAPLAGAALSLHAAEPAGGPAASGRRYGDALASARSDERGAFHLPCAADGVYWLRAEAPGAAAGDWGPLEIDARSGWTGAQLALSRGGAIEGVARPARSERPEGVVIVASRGDGFDRTTTTDAAGAFRFDQLAEGPWVVERAQQDPANDAAKRSRASVLCDVKNGVVLRVELSAPDADLAQLRGAFTLGGEPARGWTATVGGRRAQCDPHGAFELAGLAPDAQRIVLEADWGLAGSWRVEGELWLREGANEWRLDLPCGRVQGRRRNSAEGGERVHWRWRGDGAWSAHGSAPLAADGGFTLPALPAGQVWLSLGDQVPRTGETALVVGATTTIDIEL